MVTKTDMQAIEARRAAAMLVRELGKASDFIDLHKAVRRFVKKMDTRAHILGDGDYLELYQDALLRRGKGKARAAKAGQ